MKKGQSFIVEFVIFFMISFSLFAGISYLFYSQNIYYKKRIGSATSDLVNDLILTHTIEAINCKACDEATITEDIPSRIGGIFYVIHLDNSAINTTLMTEKASFRETPIFNLNETLFFSGSSKSEDKKIVIKINKTNVGVE
jgi:hypothetical protein